MYTKRLFAIFYAFTTVALLTTLTACPSSLEEEEEEEETLARDLNSQAYRDQFCERTGYEVGKGSVTCTCDSTTETCTGNASAGDVGPGDTIQFGQLPEGGVGTEGSYGLHFRVSSDSFVGVNSHSVTGASAVGVTFYVVTEDGSESSGGGDREDWSGIVNLRADGTSSWDGRRDSFLAGNYLAILESVDDGPATELDLVLGVYADAL